MTVLRRLRTGRRTWDEETGYFCFSSRRQHTRYWRDWSSDVCSSDLLHFYRDGFGYAAMMNQSPQTIGYALADSPVAMAAYYYDKFAEWTDSGGAPEQVLTYDRSEVRRVGKEWRSRRSPYH